MSAPADHVGLRTRQDVGDVLHSEAFLDASDAGQDFSRNRGGILHQVDFAEAHVTASTVVGLVGLPEIFDQ